MRLRVGLVGLGNIARKAYLRVFQELREYGIELVGAYDIKDTVLGDLRIYPSYEELLTDSQIDLLLICTPTYTHYKLIKEALESGKHVITEKPITRYLWQANELLQIASDRGLAFFVMHPRRYDPRFKSIWYHIISGTLGNLLYMRVIEYAHLHLSGWRADPELGGDVLLDAGIHAIDLINWYIGDGWIDVQVFKPDNLLACITFFYPDGKVARLEVSWKHPETVKPLACALELVGTKGKLVYSSLDSQPALNLNRKGLNYPEYSPLYSSPLDSFKNAIYDMCSAIAKGELDYTEAYRARDALVIYEKLNCEKFTDIARVR